MANTIKILLAVDGSECSEAAVTSVISLFRPDHVEVRVLHGVEWLKELPDAFRFGEGPTYADDISERRRRSFKEAEQLVTSVAGRLRATGFTTSVATPDADARRAIVDAATEWPADLIVIGSHGRTGLDRFLLGSVAESVMRHAPCSVEIVRKPRTA